MTVDVAVCVIRSGRHFLISQRKADDHFGGYWEFPGGKREEGETLELCAVREAKEEVGLDVEIESFVMTVENPYKDRRINLHFFLCRAVATRGAAQDHPEAQLLECQAVRWVEAGGLADYLFPPANSPVIRYLHETFAAA